MSEATELLRQLVAIDSINPDLVPGSAGEGEIARFIANWLERAGVEVVLDEPAPGRPNVVGIVRGSGAGQSLLLNAHMDTVGVFGMERPHNPVIEGRRLYGRGAYDMKAGLAAILMTAAAARKRSLRGDLIVTAVMDEEYASLGTSSIVKRWHADAAIVTEPTELDICVAHKGFIWFDIETIGRAAHGSRPQLGIDAIVKMGKVLQGLERLDLTLRSAPSHPYLSDGSLHASLIQGGQELSSYPAHCLLSIERRTVPGETQEIAESQVQRVLDEIATADSTFKASLKTGMIRDPFEVAEDAPIVKTVHYQAAMQLGRQPKFVGGLGWMDSALLSATGIPTVIFGPGGEGAHAVVEWADLDQLEQSCEILLATAQEFCG
jgi:acetylornithine deacetylase/succinyl-diaminopimelate desuccinylase family protein